MANKITLQCKECGNNYQVFPCRVNGSKYCSSECQRKNSIGSYWRGRKRPKRTAEHQEKIVAHYRGIPLTEEHKRHISEASKQAGVGKWMTGRKASPETRAKLRSQRKLDKHPAWNGGSSYFPYSLDWTKTLKQSIRERDGYSCANCGATQREKNFHVHHIDYDKSNCDPGNLITLCNSCHMKTNWNRTYWNNLLTERMING